MSKTVFYEMSENSKLTEAQIAQVREAAKQPIVFDEDCEELSPALVKAFRSAVSHRNRHLTPPKEHA